MRFQARRLRLSALASGRERRAGGGAGFADGTRSRRSTGLGTPPSSSARGSAGGSRSRVLPLRRVSSASRSSVGHSRSRALQPTRRRSARTGTVPPTATTITYVISREATVTATLLDGSGAQAGRDPSRLEPSRRSSTRSRSTASGNRMASTRSCSRQSIPAECRVRAAPDSAHAHARRGDSRARRVHSERRRQDGRAHVAFQLAAPPRCRLRVLRDGVWVATLFSGPLDAGPSDDRLGRSKRVGIARDGSYTAVDRGDGHGRHRDHLAPVRHGRASRRCSGSRPIRASLGLGGCRRDGRASTGRLRVSRHGAPDTCHWRASSGSGRSSSSRGTRPGNKAVLRRALTAGADWMGSRRRSVDSLGCNRLCDSRVESARRSGPSPSSRTTGSATRFSCVARRMVTPGPRGALRTPRTARRAARRACARRPRGRAATPPRMRSPSSA